MTYELKSIADLVDVVTIENADELALDLKNFINHALIAKSLCALAKSMSGDESPVTAVELGLVSLAWTPDGKGEYQTIMQSDNHQEGDPQVIIKSKPR